MSSLWFVVKVPMPGGDWFELCKCLSADGAAEVVRALLAVKRDYGVVVVIEAVMGE